jgi:hypothetical protein
LPARSNSSPRDGSSFTTPTYTGVKECVKLCKRHNHINVNKNTYIWISIHILIYALVSIY